MPFARLCNLFHTRNLRATTSLHAHLLKIGLHDLLSSVTTSGPDPSRWNAVLSTLSHRGLTIMTLRTFSIAHALGFPVDSYALCTALAASVRSLDAEFAGQLHGYAWTSGWISSVFVGGALIDFYVKMGEVGHARNVFDEIPVRNLVCANAMLCGYCAPSLWKEGFDLVRGLKGMGLFLDEFTLSILLRMCAEVPVVRQGMEVHAYLLHRMYLLDMDVFLLSSLVEMYGKCGVVEKARLVFDMAGEVEEARKGDLVLWTSMLNAYSRNGLLEDVIATFDEMLAGLITPDGIAFCTVLSACCRTGHVLKGLEYFESMRDYGIVPWPEHCRCMMDLFCKAGDIEKAFKFASWMVYTSWNENNVQACTRIWGALLSACRDCGAVEMGKLAATRALELDPHSVGIYVELSNLYANVGMWDEIEKLREIIKVKGLKKDMGSSRLDLVAPS